MLPALPSLRFDNRTDLDALHFDTLDQNGVGFHVIVAKTSYALEASDDGQHAVLRPLDDPGPLHTEDRYHDDDATQSVRIESDLAPFKPLCDVVVIGAAHAPGGKPARRFSASLHVQAADRPAPLPPRPASLNPMQSLSQHALEEWQTELATARATTLPGAVLIDKTLTVTGERILRRHMAPLRLFQSAIALLTFGLVRCNPYRLTGPEPAAEVPLRYELAQGGQCRIEVGTTAAGRVPKRHRLTPEQQTAYPAATAPAAHDSDQRNPDGRGFAPRWYLRAARLAQLPAPRIEYPEAAFSASRFWRGARGKDALVPAGFGFVGRGSLPRRERVGTFPTRTAWGADEVPQLPKDFDFRYWNGAADDQQCAYLQGDERFTLTNLCPPTTAGATRDEHGNTVVRFALPRQALFLLAADDNGSVAAMPLEIDTVVIDTDAGVVDIVWRHCLVADGSFADARLMHATTDEQLQRLHDWNAPADEPASMETPATAHTD